MEKRIKELRKRLGVNQADFGARVGGKGKAGGDYELGLRNRSDAVIFSICREFNVDENWLRTGKGDMFLDRTRHEEIASFVGGLLRDEEESFKIRLISSLAALDEEEWVVLEKFAESLIKKD